MGRVDDKILALCSNPECGKKFRAPRSFVGKTIACKSCGTRQKVDEYHEIPDRPSGQNSPSVSGPAWNDLQFSTEEESFSSFNEQEDVRAPILAGRSSEGIERDTQRYPSLHKYLALLKWIEHLFFHLGQGIAVLLAVIGLFAATSNFIHEVELVGLERVKSFVISVISVGLLSGSIWLVTYLIYLVSMAGIEIVYVLIDIEQHTRISRAYIEREEQRAT